MDKGIFTFQNLLGKVHLTTLVGVDKIGHSFDLRVGLIPGLLLRSKKISWRPDRTYGLVSWLSNGFTSLPVNILANTRYLRT